ncbi:MAG: uracil phosphoribosyltransferase [Cryomorphaceae bacterium]|nr:MAG: uracil phosphoribosyltransferase [Cryomorphaceae bacterium]
MTPTNDYSKTPSVLNRYIAEIRDAQTQKDPLRFRINLERIGSFFAIEISKTLDYQAREVVTPLGTAEVNDFTDEIVVGTILRAGLPMHKGVLDVFDRAENAFVSAYRKSKKGDAFEIQVEYMSSPDLTDKVLILTDPMLATGASMALVYKSLALRGRPKHIHVVAAIASVEGVRYTKKHMPKNTTFWVGAVDDELTAQAYIVPGLGDAGDLAYGKKS